jgi:hypothetical protein
MQTTSLGDPCFGHVQRNEVASFWRSAEKRADVENADDPVLLQKDLQDDNGGNSSVEPADTCPCVETTISGDTTGQAEDCCVEHIAMEPDDQILEAPTGKTSKWKMFLRKQKINKKVGRCLF